jgi:hypothetical protein
VKGRLLELFLKKLPLPQVIKIPQGKETHDSTCD